MVPRYQAERNVQTKLFRLSATCQARSDSAIPSSICPDMARCQPCIPAALDQRASSPRLLATSIALLEASSPSVVRSSQSAAPALPTWK